MCEYIYISAVSIGYWAFLNSELSPAISFHLLRGGEPLPFPLSAGPFSSVGIAPTCSQRGSTAADPPPLKGQQALTLFGLLQTQNISPEVLALNDVNANKDLSRTPQGCPGPPRQVPDDRNAQKCCKNTWFFNGFEMALDALGELPNVKKGSPMAHQSGQKMA